MSRAASGVVAVLVVLLLAPIAWAGAPADGRPVEVVGLSAPLNEAQLDGLREAAQAVREGLAELRALPATPANGARSDELRQQVRQDLERFLAIAGLSHEDFVRLVDRDGGIDNDRPNPAAPVYRPLGDPRR